MVAAAAVALVATLAAAERSAPPSGRERAGGPDHGQQQSSSDEAGSGSSGSAAAALTYVADCGADPHGALGAARDAIRGNRTDTSQPAIVVVRGTCRLSTPLALEARDSNVRWVGGAISGGVAVGGWRRGAPAPCAGCGSVWIADLPQGTAPVRDQPPNPACPAEKSAGLLAGGGWGNRRGSCGWGASGRTGPRCASRKAAPCRPPRA